MKKAFIRFQKISSSIGFPKTECRRLKNGTTRVEKRDILGRETLLLVLITATEIFGKVGQTNTRLKIFGLKSSESADIKVHHTELPGNDIDYVVDCCLEKLDRTSAGERGTTGLPTGFTALDAITDGIQWHGLCRLAGRPSSFRNCLVLPILTNGTDQQGVTASGTRRDVGCAVSALMRFGFIFVEPFSNFLFDGFIGFAITTQLYLAEF